LNLDDDDDDKYLSNVLGRTKCDGVETINGDVNSDGILSPREVLRLIHVETLGRFWGPTYQMWADTKTDDTGTIPEEMTQMKVSQLIVTLH
jgi:hypothetical protein